MPCFLKVSLNIKVDIRMYSTILGIMPQINTVYMTWNHIMANVPRRTQAVTIVTAGTNFLIYVTILKRMYLNQPYTEARTKHV